METTVPVEDQVNHVIDTIRWSVNPDHLTSMIQKMSQPPCILSKAAGRSTCSIFRVPDSLVEVNGSAYKPHIVSIGPFHRAQPNLQMIEELKWRYLSTMIARTQKSHGFTLENYIKALQPLEPKARECYSEIIPLDRDEFVEMLILDGVFIIELFRKVAHAVTRVHAESDDLIFTMAWIIPFFYRDLLRLENQIPFFVLQLLYDLSQAPGVQDLPSSPTLATLALNFFNDALPRKEDIMRKHGNLKANHLLDLLRSSFIPHDRREPTNRTSTPTHIIHCVSKLRHAGIKLRPCEDETFLNVKFKNGILSMPPITIDDFMSSFLLNCVAYEQCHKSYSKHITTYATLLDCLVNTSRDVEYLSDHGIIENYFGTDGEVAQFINKLGKDVAFDIDLCYLLKLFNDVHVYYQNSWHVQWAGFKYTYFDTPWSFISALAAFVLLLLTLAQTFFTIIAYFKPP